MTDRPAPHPNSPRARYEAIVHANDAWRDAQPITRACALCDWTVTGTVHETRDAHTHHLAQAHPERQPRSHRQVQKDHKRRAA